jgi:hypothetical protein
MRESNTHCVERDSGRTQVTLRNRGLVCDGIELPEHGSIKACGHDKGYHKGCETVIAGCVH